MLNKLFLADVLILVKVKPPEELLDPGVGAVDVKRKMVVEGVKELEVPQSQMTIFAKIEVVIDCRWVRHSIRI